MVDRPHSLVGRTSAWGAGSRRSIPDRVPQRSENWEVCASQIGAWHEWVRQPTGWLGVSINGLSDSFLLTCGGIQSVAWHPKIVGRRLFHSNRSILTQYTYSRIHLHVTLNPTCSRWYNLEKLTADFKPDSPPLSRHVRVASSRPDVYPTTGPQQASDATTPSWTHWELYFLNSKTTGVTTCPIHTPPPLPVHVSSPTPWSMGWRWPDPLTSCFETPDPTGKM